MKEILIKIDEDVLKMIDSNLHMKSMCGNLYGAEDEFIVLIIDSISKGKKEITIVPNKFSAKKRNKKKK